MQKTELKFKNQKINKYHLSLNMMKIIIPNNYKGGTCYEI